MVNQRRLNPVPPLSTPEEAPWREIEALTARLDSLTSVLEKMAGITPGVPGIPGLPGLPGSGATLSAGPINQILLRTANQLVPTPTLHESFPIDWTSGARLLIKAESTLDQPVTLQAVGNISNAIFRSVNINGAFILPPSGNLTIGFAWDDWHPWVWVRGTLAVQPTKGQLIVSYIIEG